MSAMPDLIALPGAIPRQRRILLATDLSPASEEAGLQALDLARGLSAELLIVSVIDPRSLRLPGGRFGARVDQIRTRREAAAQELVTRGRTAGVRVTFLIWEGEPGESIVDAALSEQVDFVVVGSHGRGSVGRFFLGSVSDHVVHNAPCPVFVVRARASAERL
ncbi:MAG: universal stress protein [Chloroflexi bacterium]|nr:universal stress protein [Chloroflexota bacterium]